MTENSNKLLNEHLNTAILAADQARLVTKKWFRGTMDVTSKLDKTPVTIADQETENTITEIILERHPEHSILGEESGAMNNNHEWRWVIDPIDGTKCFATGMPTFGTLISLLHNDAPMIGIIDHCILDERWIGVSGQQTTYNNNPCQTRDTTNLDAASVYTTTMDMFNDKNYAQAEALTKSCQFRVFGGDCYGYGLIASGHNDIVCEADLKPYDFFALIPVVTGAGGVVTDWQGNKLTLKSNGEILASANHQLHKLAIEKLNTK